MLRGKAPTQLPRESEDTYPKLLLRNYRSWGDEVVALRKKRYGIWNEFTWGQCYLQVRGIFQGLVSLGIERGDVVAIVGDSYDADLIGRSYRAFGMEVKQQRGTAQGGNLLPIQFGKVLEGQRFRHILGDLPDFL